MSHVLIENGVVIGLDLTGNPPSEYVEAHDEVSPGYTFDGQAFFPPLASPPPVPQEISERQFFQQLANDGRITQQEALDAVGSGVIPAAMEDLIGELPSDNQFAVRMLVRGATVFRRNHPVVALIGQIYGMNDAQIDVLWSEAAQL